MKTAGVLATLFGAACMLAGALGASVPFSFPWADVGTGFMAFAFAVSVAALVVGMAVFRRGLEVAQGRAEGARLAKLGVPVALLLVAVGTVVALRLAHRG